MMYEPNIIVPKTWLYSKGCSSVLRRGDLLQNSPECLQETQATKVGDDAAVCKDTFALRSQVESSSHQQPLPENMQQAAKTSSWSAGRRQTRVAGGGFAPHGIPE